MRLMLRRRAGEEGQSLVLVGLAFVVLIGMAGLAVDAGRMFAARAELTRAVDAAALAGVQDLPDLPKAVASAQNYMMINQPDAVATVNQVGAERQLRVSAKKTVPMTFMKVLRAGNVDVKAYAVAGFGVIPVDVVLAMDNTGSMGYLPWNHRGCTDSTNSNDGCPIKEARRAANAFVDVMLTGTTAASQTVIGLTPYRGCYKMPIDDNGCINTSKIQSLTGNAASLHNQINQMTAGGFTNICWGMLKAKEVLFGSGSHSTSNTLRFLVLLSDGDNHPNSNSSQPTNSARNTKTSNTLVPSECRTKPDSTDCATNNVCDCFAQEEDEKELDHKMYDLARDMKNKDVEIFVVGLGVCGTKTTDPCDPSAIGGSHDNTNDRNLLKCIASDEDHYIEAASSTQLTEIFENIGRAIAFRLLE